MDGDGSRGHGLLIVMLLDDDERLGDGAVAMEEHEHELVHGVVCEQQLALAAHVFEDELVGHPLEAQRYLGAVDERAGEAPMSLTVSDDMAGRLQGCSKLTRDHWLC